VNYILNNTPEQELEEVLPAIDTLLQSKQLPEKALKKQEK